MGPPGRWAGVSTRPWLIVDGYNVIAADPGYRRLAADDLDTARARLVSDVAAHASGRWRGVIVFDAANNPASDGSPHGVAGVTVIFSRAGEDADAVIEGLALRARERGEEGVVATSDAATQWAVMGSGMRRMSASELLDAMGADRDEWRQHTPSGEPRSHIADRLDPETREALARWARGTR